MRFEWVSGAGQGARGAGQKAGGRGHKRKGAVVFAAPFVIIKTDFSS